MVTERERESLMSSTSHISSLDVGKAKADASRSNKFLCFLEDLDRACRGFLRLTRG